jgi:hypothetical protein
MTERCHCVLNIYSEQNEHQRNVITCGIFTEDPYIGYTRLNYWLFFYFQTSEYNKRRHPICTGIK